MEGCGLREASVAACPPVPLALDTHPPSHPPRWSHSAAPSSLLRESTVGSPCFLPLPSWKVPRAVALGAHGGCCCVLEQHCRNTYPPERGGFWSHLGSRAWSRGQILPSLPHIQLSQAEGPPTLAGLLQYILLLLLMSDATRQAPFKRWTNSLSLSQP